MNAIWTILFVSFLIVSTGLCAQTRIDVEAYRRYRESRAGLTPEGLLQEYPTGVFLDSVRRSPLTALYLDSLSLKYKVTDNERELIQRHGFVVTERLSFLDYHKAYYDIYTKDLPVYISSDALLHAFHRSYANILKQLEREFLVVLLADALDDMSDKILRAGPVSTALGRQARADVDVYVAVARALIHGKTMAKASDSASTAIANAVLKDVLSEKVVESDVFSSIPRMYDYSQFKPRGHYAGDDELEKYFRAMMWLGRTEISLAGAKGLPPAAQHEDVRRQCGMAVYMANIVSTSTARRSLGMIDTLLRGYIGDQDNVTTTDVLDYVETHTLDVDALVDDAAFEAFQGAMRDAGAECQILSQVLTSDGRDGTQPATSWMLMGQRFLFDSFILSNVVYDRTVTERLMPDPLDALFVLGNDATGQLLLPEITKWNYAENLAALRYLSGTLGDQYWTVSLYTSWLGAIRALNPPSNRSGLPEFMQTAAWWQKSINSQLVSWAELRHDNLLYGKQSYTSYVGCYYPRGFLEPVPELYRRLGEAALQYAGIIDRFRAVMNEAYPLPYKKHVLLSQQWSFLLVMSRRMFQLDTIATKELASIPLADNQTGIFDSWIMDGSDPVRACTKDYTGIYPSLFYDVPTAMADQPIDHLIADVHTQPTDENGALVGRVLHVGTGKTNLAIVTADDVADGCLTAYVGPVGSYYQHVTQGFLRMSDEEWQSYLKSNKNPARPRWTDIYLADKEGRKSQQRGPTLVVTSVPEPIEASTGVMIAPNPTVSVALITVTLVHNARNVRVEVLDVTGRSVRVLADHALEQGTAMFRWDGMTQDGLPAASALYTVRIIADGNVRTSPLSLSR